jgi:hypothetical protein
MELGVLPASHELSRRCVGEPTGILDPHDDEMLPDMMPDIPYEPARQDMGEPMNWRVYEAGLKGPDDEQEYEPAASCML